MTGVYGTWFAFVAWFKVIFICFLAGTTESFKRTWFFFCRINTLNLHFFRSLPYIFTTSLRLNNDGYLFTRPCSLDLNSVLFYIYFIIPINNSKYINIFCILFQIKIYIYLKYCLTNFIQQYNLYNELNLHHYIF